MQLRTFRSRLLYAAIPLVTLLAPLPVHAEVASNCSVHYESHEWRIFGITVYRDVTIETICDK